MKLIDLQKQTASVNTAATVNLGAAVSGFRTLSAAITADVNDPYGIKVGDKGVPFIVRDPASGAFEFSLFTVTAATVLTRERVLSSTNGNAAVAFGGVSCEVYSSLNGAVARKFDMGTSVRTVYTSSVCPDDGVTDLSMGPTTGPSVTALLQKLFDLNNDGTPLRIIWDSKYSLDSASSTFCLLVNSNTEVVALPGCGAVMRANQPTSMFRNRNPVVVKDGSAVKNVVDRNISFKGGIWHGNQDNQSVRETSATGGIFLFDFLGVDNLNMSDGIEWRRPVSFAFRGTNVSNVLLQNFFVNFGMDNTKLNSDGIHFNGPAQHLRLMDGRIYGCADDSLSFTANDIFLAPGNYGPFGGVYGPITDVTVDNMEIHSIAAGIRLLSSASRMDRFSISNIKGDFGGNWLVIDNFTENPAYSLPNGPGNIGTVMIRDIHAQNRINGGWPKKGAYLNCQLERLIFDGVHREYFENEFFPAIWCGPRFKATQLLIENYTSMNTNGGTYMKDQIFFDAGCQIQQVKIKGAMFHSNNAVDGCPIAIETGAVINQFVLDDCQGLRFTDFVRKSGTVASYHVGTNCYMDSAGNAASTWNLQSGAPWVEDTTAPNKLAYSGNLGGVVAAAIKKTADGFSGNAVVSADIKFSSGYTSTSPVHAALVLRSSNIPNWSSSNGKAYGLDISAGEAQVKIIFQSNGSDTTIGSAVPVTISPGVAFRYFLSAKTNSSTGVTTLVAKVKRLSDGNWLSGPNTWSATEVAAITATDSNLPAVAGGWGFYAYNEYVTNGLINFDNIDLSAA